MLESWVDELPMLFRRGDYLSFFLAQPVLDASTLADVDLLRANQILGLSAHATWHVGMKPLGIDDTPLPQSILVPWRQVSERLGRPKPTFTYHDYFTANVTHAEAMPRDAAFDLVAARDERTIDCDVRLFGDPTEARFVILNHAMEWAATGLVEPFCAAHDAVVRGDGAGLIAALRRCDGRDAWHAADDVRCDGAPRDVAARQVGHE